MNYFCRLMRLGTQLFSFISSSIILLFASISLHAQNEIKVEANTELSDSAKAKQKAKDSSLVKTYTDHFAYSVFLQQKLIGFHLHGTDEKEKEMVYRTNHATVLGLGITYRYVTISGSFNIIQTNKEKTVRTRGIDLGTQFNGHRFSIFLTSQYFKGFYSRNALLKPSADVFYKRPNMSMTLQGASVYYGLSDQFSFSGNMSRMQYQKKSAGTPMVGMDLFYYLQSDTAPFVPVAFYDAYPKPEMNRLRIWSLGPGIGYGYNLNIDKHFFFSAMVNAKMPINFVRQGMIDGSSESTVDLGLNLSLWGRFGYNRDAWNLSLMYMNTRIPIGKGLFKTDYVNNSGLLRLNFTRRIKVSKRAKKIIKPVDKFLDVPLDVLDELK